MTAGPAASPADVLARDRGLVWHPYAPLTGTVPYAVAAAEGIWLDLVADDGERFRCRDAMSSWWAVIHGYRNPVLDAAVREQLDRFAHVMFGGLTHVPGVALAEVLVDLTPEGLDHVFLADSGSVSVEVALKAAVQYQRARGRRSRHRFLALRGGYHGDTLGAMSVCDPVDGMHADFPEYVPRQRFLPRPPPAQRVGEGLVADADAVAAWIAHAEETVARLEGEIAAIVVEPVLQGAGGMYVYAPECLAALRRLATAYDLILLADEIATGFGRTGRLFGCDWAAVVPDIMCVGKALSGGYLTLGAVLVSRRVAEAIGASDHPALLHGPTFMGNPLACAVALASLTLLRQNWFCDVARIEPALAAALAPAREIPQVRDVRVLGAVGVIELTGPVDIPRVTREAVERGVWVRPFRSLVYAMPPYVCSAADIAAIGAGMVAAVAQVYGGGDR
ncbi:MAG: adenosylmethionine--8-amino-7-oxononanoate transaminase [Tetrasphaera sp.]